MKLMIVSGLSGSGKTVALHTLEDAGYFCVDNLPIGLLSDFVTSMQGNKSSFYEHIAVAVDARCDIGDIGHFESIINEIKGMGIDIEVLFLTSKTDKLLTRFNETRRKHPLSRKDLPLVEAIHLESSILRTISNNADLVIFLVSGEEKAEPLRVVLEGQKQTDRFPSQLIEPTQGKLLWLVDQAAARMLRG